MLTEREAAMVERRCKRSWLEALAAREKAEKECSIAKWEDMGCNRVYMDAQKELKRCRDAWEVASTAHEEIKAWQEGA